VNREGAKARSIPSMSAVALRLRDLAADGLFALRRALPVTAVHFALLVAAMVSLTPFLWLLCATFKNGDDLFAYTFLPWSHLGTLTTENYTLLFQKEAFGRWLVNSLFLSSAQTAIVVTLSSLGGFALAKYEFRGKRVLMAIMLVTMLLPAQVLLPSAYELINALGWMNTYFAIIAPGAVSVFGMLLFRQAMQGVPDELIQAGRVDGCSELRLWWEIALPVVRPMIGAFTLMNFLANWNSFIWPQIVLQDEARYTLPMGLANMTSLPEYQTSYGMLMVGTLIGVLPVAVLFFALQRDFIAGLTSGAVKG
jgi:ABC-type glycerol-3-phosphate transport system permease component